MAQEATNKKMCLCSVQGCPTIFFSEKKRCFCKVHSAKVECAYCEEEVVLGRAIIKSYGNFCNEDCLEECLSNGNCDEDESQPQEVQREKMDEELIAKGIRATSKGKGKYGHSFGVTRK